MSSQNTASSISPATVNLLDPVGATNNLRGLAAKIKFIIIIKQSNYFVKKNTPAKRKRNPFGRSCFIQYASDM